MTDIVMQSLLKEIFDPVESASDNLLVSYAAI